MLWERRWLIVGLAAVTSALALATRPPAPEALYRATVTLEVRAFTISAGGQTSVSPISGVPAQEVQAARSGEVAAKTAEDLGQNDGGVGLLNRLEVTPLEGTDLLQLSLTGSGSATVTDLDTYAKNYVEYRTKRDQEQIQGALRTVDERIAALEPRLRTLSAKLSAERRAGNGQATDLTIAQFSALSQKYTQLVSLRETIAIDAQFAGGTVKSFGSPIVQRLGAIPTRAIRTLAGPIVGLLLGAALAIALGILRPRISSRERTEERLGYPVLAAIPHVPSARRDPLKVQRASAWGAEGIRMLLTEIGLLEKRGKSLRFVVVASPQAHEGRTTIAVNLAASYAASGRSVALFHADRNAMTTAGSRSAQFVGQHDITDVRMHRDGFAEVFSGPARAEAMGLGNAKKGLTEIVSDLAHDFDIVIVDTRPVLMSADAVALAAQADAVIIALRHLKTMEAKAGSAIEILERHDAPIVGLVMNDHRMGAAERYRSARADHLGAPRRVTAEPVRRTAVGREGQPAGPVEAKLTRQRHEEPVARQLIDENGAGTRQREPEPVARPASEEPATTSPRAEREFPILP